MKTIAGVLGLSNLWQSCGGTIVRGGFAIVTFRPCKLWQLCGGAWQTCDNKTLKIVTIVWRGFANCDNWTLEIVTIVWWGRRRMLIFIASNSLLFPSGDRLAPQYKNTRTNQTNKHEWLPFGRHMWTAKQTNTKQKHKHWPHNIRTPEQTRQTNTIVTISKYMWIQKTTAPPNKRILDKEHKLAYNSRRRNNLKNDLNGYSAKET